jgi:hypothetical protein
LAREYEANLPPPTVADPTRVVSLPGVAPPPEPEPEKPLGALLTNYWSCASRAEFGAWRRAVMDRIIELAYRAAEPRDWQERAACPFCRSAGGVPKGLRRHLDGHGNSEECAVAAALTRQAAHALEDVFIKAESAAAAQVAARRRTERSYLTNPFEAPQLLYEGFHLLFETPPRTAEELAAVARSRLCDRNRRQCCRVQISRAALADPRRLGRLQFCVYDEARQDKTRRSRKPRGDASHWAAALWSAPLYGEFYLLDSWHNDLVGKFRTRLAQSIAELSGPTGRRAQHPAEA